MISFPRNPNASFLYNMDDLPSLSDQLPRYPPSVTFPGKSFRTEEGGLPLPAYFLQTLQPFFKGIGFYIGEITAFPEASQLLP